jgi:AcrR family transcriptional regulator
MSDPAASGKRRYRMGARAEAVAETRERILEAAESASEDLLLEDITLTAVARRANVSVQTVLRHFGNREELFIGTVAHMGMKMAGDRDVDPSWRPKRIVGVLIDHYERFGDRILWMLAQENRHPRVKMILDMGRVYHAEWCRQAFSPALEGLRGGQRERRVAQLVAATDIYTWKILRRDRQLSVAQAKLAVRELLEPLLERPG